MGDGPEEIAALPGHFRRWVRPDGVLAPPELDTSGYLRSVAHCRERFPGLRVLSGLEVSEPHWHRDETDALLAVARFDRVLGSVHTIRGPDGDRAVDLVLAGPAPADAVEAYLAEALRMCESGAPFSVLAHIDYPARSWPASAGPFRPATFEDAFRAVLEALAGSGRALEINTRVPFASELVGWWADAGGDAVSFGSDAHRPAAVGHGFTDAATTARSHGFRPGATRPTSGRVDLCGAAPGASGISDAVSASCTGVGRRRRGREPRDREGPARGVVAGGGRAGRPRVPRPGG